jgi:hypothetical protein
MLSGGSYDDDYFNSIYFLAGNNSIDFKTININKYCRWIKYKLSCEIGNINYQGFEIMAKPVSNKEIA